MKIPNNIKIWSKIAPDIEIAKKHILELSAECDYSFANLGEFGVRTLHVVLERFFLRQIPKKEAEARQTQEYADYEELKELLKSKNEDAIFMTTKFLVELD